MAELVNCERLREVGPELALGVLAGRDRAQAVAHLQDCAACEQHVRELAVVGDRLALLVPGAEPPVGFEQRVLDRLGLAPRRRWRRRRLVAAAVVLGIALAISGWVLRGAVHTDQPPFTSASITSASGSTGEAILFTDRRSWLYVDLFSSTASNTVTCELRMTDGRTMIVGSFAVHAGDADWATPVTLDGGRVADVRILAEDGSLVGTAHFG
jgi:hypothetical protein